MRWLVLALAGCLGPLTSDAPAPSGQLLPAGSTVLPVDDDLALAARIRANQQVSGVVPRYAMFGGGSEIEGWDFGTAPLHAAPMFVLVGKDGTPLDHPEIVDVAPGDAGYAPFWSAWTVRVTDAYDGQLVTSVAALDDALALGLVEAPVRANAGFNRPVVTRDVRIATDDGSDPADDAFYYRGESLAYFELGAVPLAQDAVTVVASTRYVLSRVGEPPLSEIVRRVDMDGDGDTDDSNDILSGVAAQVASSPAYATVDVTVPATVQSIDTTHDQTLADLRDAAQLFAPAPTAQVVAFDPTTEVRDIALESAWEDE